MEATGQLINTKLHHKLLVIIYFSQALKFCLYVDRTDGMWGRQGSMEGGREEYFEELLELMLVYLGRHRRCSKSIRSELGLIKIAICCPFRDIMLSIKHLIHWLAWHGPARWWLRGCLRWHLLWQCWVSRHQSVVLMPPRHTIHYHSTVPDWSKAFRESFEARQAFLLPLFFQIKANCLLFFALSHFFKFSLLQLNLSFKALRWETKTFYFQSMRLGVYSDVLS